MQEISARNMSQQHRLCFLPKGKQRVVLWVVSLLLSDRWNIGNKRKCIGGVFCSIGFRSLLKMGVVAGFKEHIPNFCMGVCVTLMYWP
jgi:hypothetical protein